MKIGDYISIGEIVRVDGCENYGKGPTDLKHAKVVGFTPQRIRVLFVLNNGMGVQRTLSPKRVRRAS